MSRSCSPPSCTTHQMSIGLRAQFSRVRGVRGRVQGGAGTCNGLRAVPSEFAEAVGHKVKTLAHDQGHVVRMSLHDETHHPLRALRMMLPMPRPAYHDGVGTQPSKSRRLNQRAQAMVDLRSHHNLCEAFDFGLVALAAQRVVNLALQPPVGGELALDERA